MMILVEKGNAEIKYVEDLFLQRPTRYNQLFIVICL